MIFEIIEKNAFGKPFENGLVVREIVFGQAWDCLEMLDRAGLGENVYVCNVNGFENGLFFGRAKYHPSIN